MEPRKESRWSFRFMQARAAQGYLIDLVPLSDRGLRAEQMYKRFLRNLLYICSALRPRSDNGTRSMRYPCAALACIKRKLQRDSFRGSITQLLHSLSTLHTRNRFLICKTRFRLLTRLYRAGHFLPARFLLKVSA